MKKLMNFIGNLSQTVYSKPLLRLLFYIIVILVLIALNLLADGQKIEFVYNDF